MPNSYAQTISLPCPQCHTAFDAEVWLIVDAQERPDLLERARESTLHELTCPHCGHLESVNAPLLVFRSLQTPPLLFIPVDDATASQNQQQVADLLAILRQQVGSAWQESWVATSDSLHWDPAATNDIASTEEDDLRDIVLQFINADSWAESRHIVAAHPELLSEAANVWLARLAAADDDSRRRVVEHRALLHRCRAVGIEQAFREKKLSIPDDLEDHLRQAQEGETNYLRSNNLADLDTALAAWLRSLHHPALVTLASGLRLAILNNAGSSLLRRYWARGRIADLEQALNLFREAVAQMAADAPDQHLLLDNLGNGLRARYAHTGQLADLEAAITAYQQAVAQTPQDALALPLCLNNLGNGLRARYAHTGQLADLEAAITAYQQAVAQTAEDAPKRPMYLNNLGLGLRARYARTGQWADLEAAITAYQQAVAQTPQDAPDRPGYLSNLGLGLRDRYARTGQWADLEAAITACQQAVAQTPQDAPDRPMYLNNLGNGLRDRYARTGQWADLEAAITACQQAVAQTAEDAPDRPGYLNNLGLGLRDRYAHTGQWADLEAAITAYQQAVAQTPQDALALPLRLNNLGNGLSDRYAHTGQLADLEAAITAYQQAVAQTAEDAPKRPMYLNNLGLGLRARYARTGRLADLEAAITAYQQAVAQTPQDAPDRPGYLSNLGLGLRDRYARTGQWADLEAAITACQQAVAQTPQDAPDRPMYLNNLGNGLRDRYARTGQWADLEAAITACQQAVAQTPQDAPNRPMYLSNLGNGLSARYARTEQWADLEAAITAYQQAVAQTPQDAPNRPMYLNNLGAGLRHRYAHTGRLEDLKKGRTVFRQACRQGLTEALAEALRSAYNWGYWASERQCWAEAGAAYRYGLTAIDRLFAVQLAQRSDQESALALGRGLHASAAYALARSGDLKGAVTTMERGRARLLAEVLERNRQDLALLPARGHADLHHRYHQAVEQRQRLLQTDEPSAVPHSALHSHARIQLLAAAQVEIDQTIAAIQQLPGYEDFFAQPTFAQIQTAVQSMPLVYLLTTAAGGLALIVHRAGVTPVWLTLTEAMLRDLLGEWFETYANFQRTRQLTDFQQWLDTVDRVTRRLWDDMMGPLAVALRPLAAPGVATEQGQVDAGMPVTLIPTGLLSLLPLHATWTPFLSALVPDVGKGANAPALHQETVRHYFLDEFVVNYAPSARALTHVTTTAHQVTSAHLLAIDEPRPVRGNALPNATAEVAAIADLFVAPQLFRHEDATRTATLTALPQAQVVHFACHGGTNWANALASGLLMAHDELLTVRDLLELQLPSARLATLSACETGIVGTKMPDEVVALPSVLVQAGFAGVVASLWSVADSSTAMLMVRFYDFWQKEKMEPVQALRAAQRWVRDTTNRQKADYFGEEMLNASDATRMPEMVAADFFSEVMMHKEGQDARSCAHPYWWAAFYLTGV